ncbi:hypothetical protein SAMN05192549_104248 [Duganella sacchari]|uniref:Uncharacterized protein n=1 Tax=Duganella sacchari TaxID=551987 RepID=A0A1M7NYG0_9BURK|nr:hypothetical protein SAMN05192549_104248 [Duganella sacchari]
MSVVLVSVFLVLHPHLNAVHEEFRLLICEKLMQWFSHIKA